MRNWIVLFFLIPALLGGCTKFGKNITVKGYVLNPVTGEGIEGIDVWLQKSSGTFPGGYKNVKEAVTDANGYYEINAAALQDRYLRASTSSDYYDIGWDSDASSSGSGQLYIETGKTTWANFLTVPYGNFQANIKNVSCQGPSDSLELFFDGSEVGHDAFQIGKINEFFGCIDITGSILEYPSGKRYYHWIVTRNNVSETFYDTVNIIPGQTAILNIQY